MAVRVLFFKAIRRDAAGTGDLFAQPAPTHQETKVRKDGVVQRYTVASAKAAPAKVAPSAKGAIISSDRGSTSHAPMTGERPMTDLMAKVREVVGASLGEGTPSADGKWLTWPQTASRGVTDRRVASIKAAGIPAFFDAGKRVWGVMADAVNAAAPAPAPAPVVPSAMVSRVETVIGAKLGEATLSGDGKWLTWSQTASRGIIDKRVADLNAAGIPAFFNVGTRTWGVKA